MVIRDNSKKPKQKIQFNTLNHKSKKKNLCMQQKPATGQQLQDTVSSWLFVTERGKKKNINFICI